MGRFIRAGAGGISGRRMRTVPSGSRSSVPRYSQSLIGSFLSAGVRARRRKADVSIAQDKTSTGSLKTLVRTLVEPASRNGFWRLFSAVFVAKDERYRAEHP